MKLYSKLGAPCSQRFLTLRINNTGIRSTVQSEIQAKPEHKASTHRPEPSIRVAVNLGLGLQEVKYETGRESCPEVIRQHGRPLAHRHGAERHRKEYPVGKMRCGSAKKSKHTSCFSVWQTCIVNCPSDQCGGILSPVDVGGIHLPPGYEKGTKAEGTPVHEEHDPLGEGEGERKQCTPLLGFSGEAIGPATTERKISDRPQELVKKHWWAVEQVGKWF